MDTHLSNRWVCASAMARIPQFTDFYQKRHRCRVLKFILYICCSQYYSIMYLLTTYTYVQFINVCISMWTTAASSLSCVVFFFHCFSVLLSLFLICCTHVASTIYCCVIYIIPIRFFCAVST